MSNSDGAQTRKISEVVRPPLCVPVKNALKFDPILRKDEETVVFSWITWPDKAVRDAGWQKIMADPRMQPGVNPMPFDGSRMIYGGFDVLLEA